MVIILFFLLLFMVEMVPKPMTYKHFILNQQTQDLKDEKAYVAPNNTIVYY